MNRITAASRTLVTNTIVTAALTLAPLSKAIAAPQKSDALAAQVTTTPAAAQVPGVPRLVRFSGALKAEEGKNPSGTITITFSLYEEEQGGNALWTETEPVQVGPDGHYSVLLGATDPGGLPTDLFNGNKPRWVGVVANAPGVQGELPRVLLVGVPYALKAADSETLGGRPASAYVTTDALSALTQAKTSNSATVPVPAATPPPITGIVSGAGTTNFLPIWTNSTTLGNSILFQNTGAVQVQGGLQLPSISTATAAAPSNSQPFDLFASAFSSSTKAALAQHFRWEAEPVGNNTTAPSATLNLLFGANVATPAETGLSINNHGIIKFATGQTFPGGGGGTITSVTAGTDLTGGGTTGAVTLNLDTTKVPQLNASNTFIGNQTVTGVLTAGIISAGDGGFAGNLAAGSLSLPATFGTTSGVLYIGSKPFLHAAGSLSNTFIGSQAGNLGNNGGSGDTGVGQQSLFSATSGINNTATGAASLQNTTTGTGNSAFGVYAGDLNSTGSYNAFFGFGAAPTSRDLQNATAIGARATVSASNSLVLGHGANVGIGTSAPTKPLTIQADDNAGGGLNPQQLLIQGNSDPSKQLQIGYWADPNGGSDGFGAIQAVHHNVTVTPLLLNPYGGNVGIRTGNSPSNVLTIGQGAGAAIADGWATYSSRRWKKNIQTLPDALAKVEQLRGVSYDLKENGKHEIGVIAEEVGQVLPEIVSWDKNGKDANGVDYTRLTAVLIEAVKQQQHEIEQQQAMLRTQSVAMQKLTAEVKSERQALRRVKTQIASSEVKLSASK